MTKFVLASGSPRRKELLEQMGLCFEISSAHGDEIITKELPAEIVEELSYAKASEVADRYAQQTINDMTVIIGADTIVAHGAEIMGKPADQDDAVRMLDLLQGDTHQVYTGVTLVILRDGTRNTMTFSEKTDVMMYPMTKEQIKAYVETGEPMDKAGVTICNTQYPWQDKAGGYGIQEAFGTKYIKKIDGDYNNVVGLPASRLYQELVKLGLI